MTAESRLYCINTQSLTGSSNPFWDTGDGTYTSAPIAQPLPGLFDSSGTLPPVNFNLNTDSLFTAPPTLSGMSYDQFGMTPAFTGDIFNMSIETPNIELYNQMFTNIMAGFQQQVQNMQTQFMNGMGMMQPYYDEDTSYFSYDAQELKAKWSKTKPNLSEGFYNKVVEISKRIGCDPNDLMGLMYSESTLNPAQGNGIGATGLIQFLPSTAKALGTTCADLKAMSPEQQLVYVEKCLQMNKRLAKIPDGQKIGRGTLYALIFLPARANRNVLTQRGEVYYDGKNGKNGNQGLDLNKDGYITKADLDARIQNKIREGTGMMA